MMTREGRVVYAVTAFAILMGALLGLAMKGGTP